MATPHPGKDGNLVPYIEEIIIKLDKQLETAEKKVRDIKAHKQALRLVIE